MLRTVRAAGARVLARPRPDERALDVLLRVTGLLLVPICLAGGAWGFQRGMAYPPTLWAAVIEGGVVFGLLGLLPAVAVGAVVGTRHRLRRHA